MASSKQGSKTTSVTAVIGGKKYTAKGKTILEALDKLEVGNIHSMVVLIVDGKERVIPTYRARKAFNTAGLVREVELKKLSLMYN